MVSVYFGYDKSAILCVDTFFGNVYEYEWFDDPIVREMIRDIDHSTVLSSQCIQSPILGQIPPEMLSGGVKTCIMLYKMDNFLPDLTACGENCEKWLSYIFYTKELVRVTMSGHDLTFRGLPIHGICENDGSEIKDYHDWINKMFDMAGEEENER